MRGHQAREARRQRGEERSIARAARTPSGQLAVLDTRLGEGEGAVRERAKLLRKIEATAAPRSPSPSTKERKEKKERSKAKDRRRDSRRKSRKGTRAKAAD